jgi:hypothetical protein
MNLGEQQLDVVDDIVNDSSPTGQYEKLKTELIHRLTDSDWR